jgi:hypothetical protein
MYIRDVGKVTTLFGNPHFYKTSVSTSFGFTVVFPCFYNVSNTSTQSVIIMLTTFSDLPMLVSRRTMIGLVR